LLWLFRFKVNLAWRVVGGAATALVSIPWRWASWVAQSAQL